MKRFAVLTLLLMVTLAVPMSVEARSTKQPPHPDMSGMNKIFVGWVDMHTDAFTFLGYDTRAEWAGVIDNLNAYFLQELKSEYLPGKTITGAKNAEDVDASGNDLYIKFTEVSVDSEYRLHLTIHFIDAKTGAEIGLVPNDRYTGRVCGLVGCLEKSLNKVGQVLNVEITLPPRRK